MKRLIPVLLLIGLGCPREAVAENIALGKPYEWSTPPRYGTCTDDGDTTQLTDGITSGADWGIASTVGWVHQGRVEVTIDLGSPQPIDRVAFVAAGGGLADVFFPAVAAVLTSDDGDAWYVAGAVGSGALVQDRSKSYARTFETGSLAASGRYVRLVFQAEERYLFLDEIEIHSADAGAPRGNPLTGEDLEALIKRCLTARWVAGEWPGFRRQIAVLVAPEQAEIPAAIATQLELIDARVARVDVSDGDEVETLRRAYTRLRAEAARASHGARVHVQRAYPWGDYRGDTLPLIDGGLPADLDLTMWQDEYETAAWAATNLTDAPVRLSMSISALTDAAGREHSWKDRLWRRNGVAVPCRLGHRVMDALPLLGDGQDGEVEIGPGEYGLLWLTIHARDLPAGDYRAEVRVEAAPGDVLLKSPLSLTIAPLRMPPADGRALAAYNWEQLTGWNQPPEAAADLRAHGVNTFMLHPVALPVPTFDVERARLESVDFGPLDAALARCDSQPRMHGVFWGGNPSFWGLDLASANGAEMFRQFIRAWAAHLEA
ncbi:MAG TPA: discoidin domain-containing protein, partial [Armatimonadota bacterium]|nr:discoidin domain-containing protein [Armatimonadota bacterium]